MRRFMTALLATMLLSMVAAPAISANDAGIVPAPTGVSGNASSSQIDLSWSAVDNAAGYNVYRNDGYHDTVNGTSYRDTKDLRSEPGSTTYEYYVTAFDEAKNFSSKSDRFNVQFTRVGEPEAEAVAPEERPTNDDQQQQDDTDAVLTPPSNVWVSDDGGLTKVNWDAVDGAGGYDIYRGDDYKATLDGTSWTDPDVPASYSYAVVAFNQEKAGHSSKSTFVKGLAAPTAPVLDDQTDDQATDQTDDQTTDQADDQATDQTDDQTTDQTDDQATDQTDENQDVASLEPPANIGFELVNNATGVNLYWSPVDGAFGYNVYNQIGDFNGVVATVFENQIDAAGFNTDGRYYVTAFDESRQVFSAKSESVQLTQNYLDELNTETGPTAELAVPGIPQDVRLEAAEDRVRLVWTPVEGATGYVIYRNAVEWDTSSRASYGGPPVTGEYSVASRNANGDSERSAQVRWVLEAVDSPTNVRIEQYEGRDVLRWSGGNAAADWEVWLNGDTLVSLEARPHYYGPLVSGDYHIVGVDYTGTVKSDPSESLSYTADTAVSDQLAAPANFRFVYIEDHWEAWWDDVEGAERYRVVKQGGQVMGTVESSALRADFPEANYKVFAMNASETVVSPPSNNVYGPLSAPGSPGIPQDVRLVPEGEQEGVRLEWTPVDGAYTYVIYRNGERWGNSGRAVYEGPPVTGDYSVASVNGNGDSQRSDRVLYVLDEVEVPSTPRLGIYEGQDILSWSSGNTATDWEVWLDDTLVSVVRRPMYFGPLVAGVYRVVGVDYTGTKKSEPSEPLVYTPAEDAVPPETPVEDPHSLPQTIAAPDQLSARLLDGNVARIEWASVDYAVGYNVYRNNSEEPVATVFDRFFEDTITPNGDIYYVVAFDESRTLFSTRSDSVIGPELPIENSTGAVTPVLDLDDFQSRDPDELQFITDEGEGDDGEDGDGEDPITAVIVKDSGDNGISWKNVEATDDSLLRNATKTDFVAVSEANLDLHQSWQDSQSDRGGDRQGTNTNGFITFAATPFPTDVELPSNQDIIDSMDLGVSLDGDGQPGSPVLALRTMNTGDSSGPPLLPDTGDSLDDINDLVNTNENAAGIIHNSGAETGKVLSVSSANAQQITKSLDGTVTLSDSTVDTHGLELGKNFKAAEANFSGAKATFDGTSLTGDHDAVQRSVEDGKIPDLSDLDSLETGITINKTGMGPDGRGIATSVKARVDAGKIFSGEISADVTEFRDLQTVEGTINKDSVEIASGEADIREEKATFKIGADGKKGRLGVGVNGRAIDTDTVINMKTINVVYDNDADGTRSDDAQRHADTAKAQLGKNGGDYKEVETNMKSNQHSTIVFDVTASTNGTDRPASTEDVFNLETETKRKTLHMTSRDGTVGGDDDYSNGSTTEHTVEETAEDGVDAFRVSQTTHDGLYSEGRNDEVSLKTSSGIDITKTPEEIKMLSNNALWYGGKDNSILRDIANGKSAPQAVVDDKPSFWTSWLPGNSHDNTDTVDAIEKIELARELKASDDNLIRKAQEHKKKQDAEKAAAEKAAADKAAAAKAAADKAAAEKAAADKAAAEKAAAEKEAQRQRDSDTDQREREERQASAQRAEENRQAIANTNTGGDDYLTAAYGEPEEKKEEKKDSGGDSGGDESRVVCTHFYQAGRLDRSDWVADLRFTQQNIGSQTVRGYHAWGIPAVRLMRSGSFAGRLIDRPLHFIATRRARELAYKMGRRDTPDYVGKLVRLTMEPMCWVIGAFVGEQNWRGLYSPSHPAPAQVQL